MAGSQNHEGCTTGQLECVFVILSTNQTVRGLHTRGMTGKSKPFDTENDGTMELKRSKKEETMEDGVLRPVKLSRKELYKPPDADELNQLREAESLFHCNLLKMQMEELLKEVVLSEHRKCMVDSFIQKVTKLLQTVPRTSQMELNDLSWLSSEVKVPFLLFPKSAKGKFHMEPPASVSVVGSYPLGTCIKPRVSVDLAVIMPPAVLQPKDALNQRYPRKRALYLAGLAQHLLSSPVIGSLRYSCLHGNRLRPLLLVTPPGADSNSITLRLHVCPSPGFFKPSRFHPLRNNVRTYWYTGLEAPTADTKEPPTPHYNSSVLGDHLPKAHLQFLSAISAQCAAFTDAVALLKVWLRQRELHQGVGSFSGFVGSMLVAYLLSTHRVGNTMTAYQLLRNSLNFLATTDLTKNGITLAKDTDSTAPTLSEFHDSFQVVFVDPSGHLNLCADMTANTYKQVQHEAALSLQFWDDPTLDGFQALLMTPKPFLRTYDHVFQLCELVKLQSSCKKLKLLGELMDHSGDYVLTVLPCILSLLQHGLGKRVHLLTHALCPEPEWSVVTEPPKHKDLGSLSFGLLLNPELSASVLERGPPADSAEAVEFRQLWGPRAELRRFQDGAITEAVLWSGSSACQKRLVPREIITHLLQLHADIPESCVRYRGGFLDDVIRIECKSNSTGDEESLRIVQSYDDLSRKLWQLEGLPLSITSVQAAHPALRYSQVFPPVPHKLQYSFFGREKVTGALLPLENKPCPAYIPPLKVICHMEGSGKWPLEELAIRHIKAAFHIRLGEQLRKCHGFTCSPTPTHLDVYKDGYVFRIQVAYHREPQILRQTIGPDGMLCYRDNDEAQALELETIHRPYLTSTLHGLQQQHPAFGVTCRLAKRWLAAQLFSGEVGEDATDLLVASLFLQPAPFSAPGSPLVGFLRFLHLLSSFDWKTCPLVVNLNGQLTVSDYAEIKNDFIASREMLPVMFIATPKDKKLSLWTKDGPSVLMLQRLTVVAEESLRVLETQLKDCSQGQDVRVVLRPPLDVYDVLIHLSPKHVPLLDQAVDVPHATFSRGTVSGAVPSAGGALPVIDFNPVTQYMTQLRDAFGHLALFFCDPYGSTVIAVLWKPQAFASQPFKTSQMSARRVEVSGELAQSVPNVEAILEDFRVMGEGLVKKVEPRTENWVV
ncbi:nucleolar protein 6 isoform X2 [Brienomyrus brachyistius]|uniref:nucleolar protein 6 isoform X2 n=1 Tax=Brienomyrus brachyistius TaxID=42636 RepID=UPI0020B23AD7|nr:nucleolar protein 6 isoform X2 [Brienomyrus brachyistius]